MQRSANGAEGPKLHRQGWLHLKERRSGVELRGRRYGLKAFGRRTAGRFIVTFPRGVRIIKVVAALVDFGGGVVQEGTTESLLLGVLKVQQRDLAPS